MIQNLVADDSHHLEALLATDAVDNHVSVDANEVLAIQDCVFVLCYPTVSMTLVISFCTCRGVPGRQCR
jgi:hypothetical protein